MHILKIQLFEVQCKTGLDKKMQNIQSRLIDKYGRQLSYLRLSVTDRCNLRCYYCMPDEGVRFSDRKDVMSWDEMFRLTSLFTRLGVSKIRITGGEPFVRSGLLSFLQRIRALNGLHEISITTNATLINNHIAQLKALRITQLNISLDSLNEQRFYQITRRNCFTEVHNTVFALLAEGFTLKLNCVVSAAKNTDDILPFVELTRQHNVSVRFLEEMPFNGSTFFNAANWNYNDIYAHISRQYGDKIIALPNAANATSVNYKIQGYAGAFGIIPSYSRTFCGTCNRLRLSATGEVRTCLYAAPALNLKDAIRSGANDNEVTQLLLQAVAGRAKNGFEAEEKNTRNLHSSMSVLGG